MNNSPKNEHMAQKRWVGIDERYVMEFLPFPKANETAKRRKSMIVPLILC